MLTEYNSQCILCRTETSKKFFSFVTMGISSHYKFNFTWLGKKKAQMWLFKQRIHQHVSGSKKRESLNSEKSCVSTSLGLKVRER